MSRIILKFSGEYLKKDEDNVSTEKLEIVYKVIKKLQSNHHQVGIVIGGGNFFRGREHKDMDKVTADSIGIMGTIMNALYLKDYLDKKKIANIISTPFNFPELIPMYDDSKLKEEYDNNTVIIFGGGVGKSGFSTDSGTILALKKVSGNMIIKMTNVDGVYDSDPKINKNAKLFKELSYDTVIKNKYKVMDSYAFKECQKLNIKILVLNIKDYEHVNDYFEGKSIGTIIGG